MQLEAMLDGELCEHCQVKWQTLASVSSTFSACDRDAPDVINSESEDFT